MMSYRVLLTMVYTLPGKFFVTKVPLDLWVNTNYETSTYFVVHYHHLPHPPPSEVRRGVLTLLRKYTTLQNDDVS